MGSGYSGALNGSGSWSENVRQLAGARLRRTRIQQSLSVRTVAEKANLSKTTVVAVEAGRAIRVGSYLKVAELLGLHLDVLLREAAPNDSPFAVHRREDDEWFDLSRFGDGPLPQDAQHDQEERNRLALEGKSPLNILRSRLDGGRIKPTIIEVSGPSERRIHPGEEHLFVLSGSASISVGGHVVELEEGESITFWSSEPHSYAPKQGSKLPTRLLSVRVDS